MYDPTNATKPAKGTNMFETLLPLGLDLLGGIMGRKSQKRATDAQNRLYQQSLNQAQGQFDAQMDQSIQRRVSDAKKAGVHPLFAMGASVGASPTLSAGQPPRQPTGSAMGDALTAMSEKLGFNRVNAAQAARDEAEAQLLNSQRKRIELELMSQGRDGARTYAYGEKPVEQGSDVAYGQPTFYQPEIPKHAPGKPHLVAGTKPGFIEIKMPDGRVVENYDPDLGLDEIGQINYALERARHYTTDAMFWTHERVRKYIERQKKRRVTWQRPKTVKRRY